ncbi:Receptor-Type Tyrosine-Protein Phosphatase U [Manis pentadactyla]|nr:Receptor-Type Tyrosine-Protein Phosphatase U [Manis pentadactyla]
MGTLHAQHWQIPHSCPHLELAALPGPHGHCQFPVLSPRNTIYRSWDLGSSCLQASDYPESKHNEDKRIKTQTKKAPETGIIQRRKPVGMTKTTMNSHQEKTHMMSAADRSFTDRSTLQEDGRLGLSLVQAHGYSPRGDKAKRDVAPQ